MLPQVLIRPADVSPSSDDFEVIGTFNPGAVQTAEGVVLLVRVAERAREARPGFTGLPRWDAERGAIIDWANNEELESIDPRLVRRKSDGLARLPFFSYLKVIRSRDGEKIDSFNGSIFAPDSITEEFGVEDARITPLEGRFYITYVAVSRQGVATALASTEDFRTFTRHGLMFGPENKDIVLLPERIAGQYVAIHRPSGSVFSRPEMWIARSPDLIHWGQHRHLMSVGEDDWDSGRIGAGPPPIRIPEGWLLIYHGSARSNQPGHVGAYSAGAVLLAHDDPSRILARSRVPFHTPTADCECEGFVPNVVFPTGLVVDGESLLVYYGGADTCTAVTRISVEEVLSTLHPV